MSEGQRGEKSTGASPASLCGISAWGGMPNAGKSVDSVAESCDCPIPEGLDHESVSKILFGIQNSLARADSYCMRIGEFVTKVMKNDPYLKTLMFDIKSSDIILGWMMDRKILDRESYLGGAFQLHAEYVSKLPPQLKHMGANASARTYSAQTKAEIDARK